MPNYNFVINSSFKPFTMQEMLVPFTAYKEAYEQMDEAYTDLTAKADKFKYLSENLPEGSKARELYEGYANELNAQATDLATNGLSMNNRRALSNLRRRYSGEIGRLDLAQTALDEELKARRAMNQYDTLFAANNLTIDDFLDNNRPNLYYTSKDALYKRGAQAAQSASSRIFSNPTVKNLTKYYQDIAQTQGYSPELLDAFRNDLSLIPELNQDVDNIMKEFGVDENLTGNNREIARQSIINGIMDGVVFKSNDTIKENPGVMSPYQSASLGLSAASSGMIRDSSSPTGWRYDARHDPRIADELWKWEVDDSGRITGLSEAGKEYTRSYGTSNGTSTGKVPDLDLGKAIKINISSGTVSTVGTGSYTKGTPIDYESAKKILQKKGQDIDSHILSGNPNDYFFYQTAYDITIEPNPNAARNRMLGTQGGTSSGTPAPTPTPPKEDKTEQKVTPIDTTIVATEGDDNNTAR